jgi:inosine-uridine nucleoside N-ribohydrolase
MKKRASSNLPQSVWLDTDIGDDTDDILALALICASPELKLAGVSTVFGDTDTRARLARTLLASLREPSAAPVAAGCGRPLPGWFHPELWPNGSAESPAFSQRACARRASALPAAPRLHGVELLAQHLRTHPGQTVPITIGALTNIATLLLRAPELQAAIPRLVVMGGDFQRAEWEWNIRCDPLAAACVLQCGLPIDFIPWAIGMTCTVSAAQVRRLHAAHSRTGRLISRAVRLWQKSREKLAGRSDHPHLFDPMAVAVLLHPEWFEWRRGRVEVLFSPKMFSRTRFTPDPAGPHRVAFRVRDPKRAVETVWARILSL